MKCNFSEFYVGDDFGVECNTCHKVFYGNAKPEVLNSLGLMCEKEIVIGWWSGGVTSAVTCKLCIDLYPNMRIIFIDTGNEDPDTYRFKNDCQKWYSKEIETLKNDKYGAIEEVWRKYKSLNVAHGAICSTELKRSVREQFQKENSFSHQAFGFDITEINRAKAMKKNYPEAKAIFPLINELLAKKDCIEIIQKSKIEIPSTYKYGFINNNCFNTGCVQGGVGYWQKMKVEFPAKFEKMASIEHELTDLKGQPVTMLKDQSKNGGLVFLKPHPSYPLIKDISMMKGREPKPLFECNGFCGINDLVTKNETENEINYSK